MFQVEPSKASLKCAVCPAGAKVGGGWGGGREERRREMRKKV